MACGVEWSVIALTNGYVLVCNAAGCDVVVSPAPCHLRPSDKQRLAADHAAEQAVCQQRALDEHIDLLTVS